MKGNILILGIIFLTYSALTFAQISKFGTPKSFDTKLSPELNKNIKFRTVDATNITAYKAEDVIKDAKKDSPWRFGENIFVDYGMNNSGTWDILENGDKIWRLGVYSPGALTINLTFDKYKLPVGAELYIYNSEKTEILGAFTSENNQEDGAFATTLIKGDAVIIEYYEPYFVSFNGEINLWRVTHGYRNAFEYADKAFGSSGSCNKNVACPEAVGWENEIRAVCMLVSGGSGFCTGTLINNTANDGTPYVLTADHCYSTPTSWVFWFNWQSATCTNPSTSPSYNSVTGATLRARNAASDFCLVQINSVIPSNFNVYYAGWNRTTSQSLTETVTGIHHPSGDIKKFSYSTTGVTTTTYLQNPIPGDGTHWRVTTWSGGTTTEGGSSGSAIFDANHRIIGQLHGGYASCSSNTSDWYGILGVSWTGGGTNATRLSNWLDPSGTAPMTLDGYDPNTPAVALDARPLSITVPASTYCSPETVTPEVVIKNNGTTALTSLTITYDINGTNPVIKSWTGNLASGQTENVTFDPIALTVGSHTFNVATSAPNSGTDETPSNDAISKAFIVSNSSTSLPFIELFENTQFPPCNWVAYRGTNGIGTAQDWTRTTTNTYNSSAGSAYVKYENVTGGTAEDWLVTPFIQLGSASNLTFYERQAYGTDYSTSYKIKVSTTSQTTHASFTDVASYGESTFGTTYSKRTIDLSTYDNQQVYIAFVMAQDDGDDWYIDSVRVNGNFAAPVADFSANSTTACVGSTVNFTDNSTNSPSSWAWTFNGGTPATSTLQNPIVTYSTAGTYDVSLTVTNASGSDSKTMSSYIVVAENPVISLSSSSDVSCFGFNDGNITITVSSGTSPFTYIWSNGNNALTASNLIAGSYTVTVGDANGCIDSETYVINEPAEIVSTETVVPASSATTADGSASVSVSGGTSPYNYLWSNSETTNSISNVLPATYYVTITDLSGCFIVDTVVVNYTIGINEISIENIYIYPNPNSGKFNLLIDNCEVLSIRIYSLSGQLVYTNSELKNKSFELELKDIGSGVYYLNVVTRENVKTSKLIIE